MLTIHTAARRFLPEELKRHVGPALEKGEVIVLVPDQLTLETELELMDALKLSGSFRLSVMSPKRLMSRIFEEAGHSPVRQIDEKGKAILISHLLRQHSGELKYYKSAAKAAGCEDGLINEITLLKQAGLDLTALERLSRSAALSATRAKLNDVRLLMECYLGYLGGKVHDLEDETREAVSRIGSVQSFECASAVVYGFDITTAPINQLIAGLGKRLGSVDVLLPLPSPDEAGAIYEPLVRSIDRLKQALTEAGVPFAEMRCGHIGAERPITRALRRLYAFRRGQEEPVPGIHARMLLNPVEEAEYVAATIRELVRLRGWRFSDVCVAMDDENAYRDAIETAFDRYCISFFMQNGRSAVTAPLPAFLNETLRIITNKAENLSDLCETGFTGLEREEIEALSSYMAALRLRMSALMRPFTRGSAEMIASNEPIRQKLMAPILALRERLRSEKTMNGQLNAIFEYLTDQNCLEKAEGYRSKLLEMGLQPQADMDIRYSNLLTDSFDQMSAVLGNEALSLTEIQALTERALDAVVMKSLPQSRDAVSVTSPQRLGMRGVKALFLMGQTSEEGDDGSGVFTRQEREEISSLCGRYISPDPLDLNRTRRMYVKDALLSATDEVYITFPSSGMDGSANTQGHVISELKRAIKGFKTEGGVKEDKALEALLMSSPRGALSRLASRKGFRELDEMEAGTLRALKEMGQTAQLEAAARFTARSESITPREAARLYSENLSVTRLEKFAGCPFMHFISEGLRPLEETPFEIDPLKRGVLMHSCMERLLRSPGFAALDENGARECMRAIFENALSGEFEPLASDSLENGAKLKELRRAAIRASVLLNRQLKKGVFAPVALEMSFTDRVEAGNDAYTLKGKIDRVDKGSFKGLGYVFVVDYKSGGTKLDPASLYTGQQMQLMTYLKVAKQKYASKSAGVYYFRLADKPISTVSLSEEAVEEMRTKEARMKGIYPDDRELLLEISEHPEKLINADFNKSGELKGEMGASQAEFELLSRHTRRLMENFTKRIYEGETSVAPMKSGENDACKYCSYSPVCFKYGRFSGIKPRKAPKMSMSALKERLWAEEDAGKARLQKE
ncbi:MAG: PD-(D/E)XK nuclease family protein [Clostridiales bacterium]|nr:PD-(D/E)XK nuclease family protein [Clostridiales bacterium]